MTARQKDDERTPRYRVAWVVLAAAFLLAFWGTLAELLWAWGASEENSHGYLIVPLAAYLAWRKRGVLGSRATESSWWGTVPVVSALALYVLSRHAEVATGAALSLVLLIFGAIWLLFGWTVLRELSFPVVFLLFMIPVPAQLYSALTIPLQLLVSKVSVVFAQALGIPVFREGNVLHMAGRTLEVVQACSGLRSMMTLLCLSAIVGYLTLRTFALRTTLFVLGVPVAAFANVLRVTAMIVAFHFFGYDLTRGTAHTVIGLGVFAVALTLLLLVKGVLSWVETAAAPR